MGKMIWEIKNTAQFGEVYITGLYHIVRKGHCDLKDLNYLYNIYTGKKVMEYTDNILYLSNRFCGFRSFETYHSYSFENGRFYLGMITFSTNDSITSQLAIFEKDTGQLSRNGCKVILIPQYKSESIEGGKNRKSNENPTHFTKWNGRIELKWRQFSILLNVAADTFDIPMTSKHRLLFKRIR